MEGKRIQVEMGEVGRGGWKSDMKNNGEKNKEEEGGGDVMMKKMSRGWPPTLCGYPGIHCKPSIDTQRFTMHSVWPGNSTGHSLECSLPPQHSEDYVKDVILPAADYFQRAMSVAKKIEGQGQEQGVNVLGRVMHYFNTAKMVSEYDEMTDLLIPLDKTMRRFVDCPTANLNTRGCGSISNPRKIIIPKKAIY
ncbi:hypothetical protein H5410_042012 [Solanum commersonii]|uniref:Uncharacterized protein n=1 Tax=Solanum commersonii TaxID=4109 RepID=A0A9J5XUS2_SOLCO|nr:hypothetical protein H5410_042012 [Solanum commersonii]